MILLLSMWIGCGPTVVSSPSPLDSRDQESADGGDTAWSDGNDTDQNDTDDEVDEVDTDDEIDTDDEVDSGNEEDTGEPESDAVDYRLDGGLSVQESTVTVQTSCSMSVTMYSPAGIAEPPLVILAHGFARGPDQLTGWASHFASWGLEVAVPALCHASLWDTDHETNGADLVDLAGSLGNAEVIYAGHSAGGLAAVIAASLDSSALGVLGMDTTDADDLGLTAALSVEVPLYGLVGEPSSCNSSNNGLRIYEAAGVDALRVTESDHCDYENATDWVCTVVCQGTNSEFSEPSIANTIRGLATAALMTSAGLDDGLDWWAPGGEYYEELAGLGAISVP